MRGGIEREGNKMMRMNREEETQKWTQKERRETEGPRETHTGNKAHGGGESGNPNPGEY